MRSFESRSDGLILTGIAQDIYFAAKESATKLWRKIQRIPNRIPVDPGPTATEVLELVHKGVLADCKQTLTIPQRNALAENASYLGRKWLNILPIQKSNRLTDMEIAEAVLLRTGLVRALRPHVKCSRLHFSCAQPIEQRRDQHLEYK